MTIWVAINAAMPNRTSALELWKVACYMGYEHLIAAVGIAIADLNLILEFVKFLFLLKEQRLETFKVCVHC